MQSARIDGKPDKTTGAALADFPQAHAFCARRRQRRTVRRPGDARRASASRRPAIPSATTAREPLLVALGQMTGGKPVRAAGGRSQPGACAKAITTPLASDAVYLLAQRKAGGTLVGGPQRFCTTAAAFEIQRQRQLRRARLHRSRLCRHPHRGHAAAMSPISAHGWACNRRPQAANVEIVEMPAHLFLAQRKADAAARRQQCRGPAASSQRSGS